MKRWWTERNPRERVYLAICLLVIVIVPLLNAFSPADQRHAKLLSSREAQQKRADVVRDIEALDSEGDRLMPEIARLTFAGNPDAAIPEAIKKLQDCAAESKLHIREMKPLRARKIGVLYHAPISVRFSSTHFTQEAVPFLYRIEDPAGKLVVEKLNMSAPDAKSASVDVELQVALYTAGAPAGTIEDQK